MSEIYSEVEVEREDVPDDEGAKRVVSKKVWYQCENCIGRSSSPEKINHSPECPYHVQ